MSPTMMNGLEKNAFKVSHTAAVASPWKKYLSWLLIQGSSLCAIFPGKYVFTVAQLAIIEIVSLWKITLYSFWIR